VERHPRAAVLARVRTGSLEKAEVFDAEVVAIQRAVKGLARGKPVRAKIYSDNLAAWKRASIGPLPAHNARPWRSKPSCHDHRGKAQYKSTGALGTRGYQGTRQT